eukprot:gnl/MRDRNA2_/MRDRNA2_80510_c0_seq2.p1 gnl/MRDRNA2_/MRDRNA2_80510_c0~~gnl/MRDRNA2_/MRDRNA2_80510_c0_seq2.p1  ORF type:complete len:622 (-),score=119.31 gnl/MRDRNA2_/MRDRNA2_80510_c0_seq2:12-1766(-)
MTRAGDTITLKEHNGITYIQTPNVKSFVSDHFGCPRSQVIGAPLSESDGWAHWNHKVFLREGETPLKEHGDVFSGLTFAWLEDSNWYRVDRSLQRHLFWGKGQGCSFIDPKTDCINKITGQSRFPTHFCTQKGLKSCLPDKRFKGDCDLVEGVNPPPPPEFQYFKGHPDWGGQSKQHVDWCPRFRPQQRGRQVTGDCTDEKNSATENEIFGADSLCVQGKLNGKTKPMCVRVECPADADSIAQKIMKFTWNGGSASCSPLHPQGFAITTANGDVQVTCGDCQNCLHYEDYCYKRMGELEPPKEEESIDRTQDKDPVTDTGESEEERMKELMEAEARAARDAVQTSEKTQPQPQQPRQPEVDITATSNKAPDDRPPQQPQLPQQPQDLESGNADNPLNEDMDEKIPEFDANRGNQVNETIQAGQKKGPITSTPRLSDEQNALAIEACEKKANELAEPLPFFIQITSNGAPLGCVKYKKYVLWVESCRAHSNCDQIICNGCEVLATPADMFSLVETLSKVNGHAKREYIYVDGMTESEIEAMVDSKARINHTPELQHKGINKHETLTTHMRESYYISHEALLAPTG